MSEPRRRGRPTLVEGDSSTPVNVRIPSRDYDRACRIARRQSIQQQRDVSVSEVIRQGVRRAVESDADDDDDGS